MHPLLLGVFPVLSLLAHNRHEAHLSWALAPIAVALGITAIVWGVFALLLRDWTKGAIPASLAILMFFSFGHLVRPVIEHEALLGYQLLLPALVGQVTLLLILCAVLRVYSRPVLITRFANVAAAGALLAPMLALAKYDVVKSHGKRFPELVGVAADGAPRPDIYLIIPDAHARGDVLQDVYGYDAEPFFTELEALGFVVARQSAANYSMTPVSVASMLNLDYVAQPAPGELSWSDLRPFSQLIRHSAVESLLLEHGYKTVAFPSPAAYTQMSHFDDYYTGVGASLGFYRMVVDLTPLSVLIETLPLWGTLLSDREQVTRTLEDLPQVASDPQPTFTFVHLCLPHPPFRFGENGEDIAARYHNVDETGVGVRTPEAQQLYAEGYRRQAIYTDRRLAQVARDILRTSPNPPIILFVSDHGPRLNLHWTDAEVTDVREALGNLTAVYLPGGRAAELLYPTITPVNVMRIALNEALGMNLPMLEDRTFLSVNVEETHHMADVTWRVRQNSAGFDSLAESEQMAQPAAEQPASTQPSGERWLAPLDRTPILR